MGRDRRLTSTKLDRAQAAIEELLACSDMEFRRIFQASLRAISALRRWCAAEDEARAADPEASDDARAEALELEAAAPPADTP